MYRFCNTLTSVNHIYKYCWNFCPPFQNNFLELPTTSLVSACGCNHSYLLPGILKIISELPQGIKFQKRWSEHYHCFGILNVSFIKSVLNFSAYVAFSVVTVIVKVRVKVKLNYVLKFTFSRVNW